MMTSNFMLSHIKNIKSALFSVRLIIMMRILEFYNLYLGFQFFQKER
jgi:hypothetical protein